MEHDGTQDGNSCDQNDFIMSPTLGAGKTSWSSCSRDYLEKFLKTSQATCVLGTSSHVNILHQFSTQNKLPGQIFDANQQCALRFGSDSRKSQIQTDEEVCRLLRCDTGSRRNTIVYHAHPALEGTSCGTKKWCREGLCVKLNETAKTKSALSSSPVASPSDNVISNKRTEVINGGWGPWSHWSPCASECIIKSDSPAVGIMSSIRKCDSPTPLKGGKPCDGSDKRIKLCDASQVSMNFRNYFSRALLSLK